MPFPAAPPGPGINVAQRQVIDVYLHDASEMEAVCQSLIGANMLLDEALRDGWAPDLRDRIRAHLAYQEKFVIHRGSPKSGVSRREQNA